MNWGDQQPWETRAQWKDRTFAMHYGMGQNKLRDMFNGRMPQPGDTFTFNLSDGFADSFERTGRAHTSSPHYQQAPRSAEHQYSGRPDDWRQREYGNGGRQWWAGEGETRTERVLNETEDWDQLGVELPELILVPTPNDEGIFVITRMEA